MIILIRIDQYQVSMDQTGLVWVQSIYYQPQTLDQRFLSFLAARSVNMMSSPNICLNNRPKSWELSSMQGLQLISMSHSLKDASSKKSQPNSWKLPVLFMAISLSLTASTDSLTMPFISPIIFVRDISISPPVPLKYSTVSSIESWLPQYNTPYSLASFCTALLVKWMYLLFKQFFFLGLAYLSQVISYLSYLCYLTQSLSFYLSFYQSGVYLMLANLEQPCLNNHTLNDFLPLCLTTLISTHMRISNLYPEMRRGLAIYYCTMQVLGLQLSLYIFTLIWNDVSLSSRLKCFNDENTWMPLPLFSDVGFNIHKLPSCCLISYSCGLISYQCQFYCQFYYFISLISLISFIYFDSYLSQRDFRL